MSMSVRATAAASSTPGARGLGGPVPAAVVADPPALPADAGRGPALPPRPRAAARRATPTTRHARRVPRPAGFSRVLRRPLHDAAGRRGLVVRRRATSLRYPARYLFTFLDNHGMLSVCGSPHLADRRRRLTHVRRAVAKNLDGSVGAPVRAVRRLPDGVEVTAGTTADGSSTPPSSPPTPTRRCACSPSRRAAERAVLGAFRYSSNHALLHTDTSVLPRAAAPARRGTTWPLPDEATGAGQLRHEPAAAAGGDDRYLVTLGGQDRVDPATVIAQMNYSHPLYTPESVAAQQLLPTLDDDRLAFAGAYHGWGFHEDGAASGLRAARRLGAVAGRVAEACRGDARSTARGSPICAAHPCTTTSTPAATAGSSTWTSCRGCRAGCGRSPVPGARPLGRPTDTLRQRSTRSSPTAASTCAAAGHRAHARPGARVRVQPDHPLLVPRRRRDAAPVVAEVHNTYGGRHAYLLPPDGDHPRS